MMLSVRFRLFATTILVVSVLRCHAAFKAIFDPLKTSTLSRPFLLRAITSSNDDNINDTSETSFSSSVDFAVAPQSEEAKRITSRLGLSSAQHRQLAELAELVVEWNERINLVSRKDCREDVVFGRHILPSVALLAIPNSPFTCTEDDVPQKTIDVGTGGGFPGLPLAIAFPHIDFLLVDSVGKKLRAVEAMAEELGLENVRVHHGRAEEMVDDVIDGPRHRGAYDVCVGRSVAALPKFCFWIADLLKLESDDAMEGKLVYIIGGEIEASILSRAQTDVEIEQLLKQQGASDKRILVFGQKEVELIAAESGEVKRKRGHAKMKSNPKRVKRSRGQWRKRDDSISTQRGYENFKRYG